MGIEPTRPAWKAGILPLNYTRMGHDKLNVSLDIITRTTLAVNAFCEIKMKNFLLASDSRGDEEKTGADYASGAEDSIRS